MPISPVYVVADDRERRQFVIALDESLRLLQDRSPTSETKSDPLGVTKANIDRPRLGVS